MTHGEMIQELYDNLEEQGALNVVRISPSIYFNADFIKGCIREIDTLHIKTHLGYEPTKLEVLGIQVLLECAGLTADRIQEKSDK